MNQNLVSISFAASLLVGMILLLEFGRRLGKDEAGARAEFDRLLIELRATMN